MAIDGRHWMAGGILRLNTPILKRVGPDEAQGIRWRVLSVHTLGRGLRKRAVCRLRVINPDRAYPAELVPYETVQGWIDSGEATFERSTL